MVAGTKQNSSIPIQSGSRPCLFFDYTLGPEYVPLQAVARQLGLKVQKRSIYTGFEHLIFGAARDSSIARQP